MDSPLNFYPDPLPLEAASFSPLVKKEVILPNDFLLLEAIYFNDIILNENSIKKLNAHEMVEALIAFYQDSPQAEQTEPIKRLSTKPVIVHEPYALHFAAREGDLKKIKALLKEGYDINKEDFRSTSPLHVAALFGQNLAVKFLIKHGAQVDAESYLGQTALHLAIYKGHYEVARTLVIDGGADPNQVTWEGQSALSLAIDALWMATQGPDFLEAPAITPFLHPQNSLNIDEIIDTLAIFIENCDTYCPYQYPEFFYAAEPVAFIVPASLPLKMVATLAPNQIIRDKILQLADKILTTDTTELSYIYAKHLLHAFPTSGVYELQINTPEDILLPAEGHLGFSTTLFAHESLNAYVETLKVQNAPISKIDLFEQLVTIYKNASEFSLKIGDPHTALEAWEIYHNGQTVLLPTGWEGHFIDVILSKKQALYAVANSGDRYPNDPAGVLFYKMHNPDNIDVKFFQETLSNQDKMSLEFDKMYEYGFLNRVNEIETLNQKYGNCGWESHRDAVEALLLIELLDKHVSSKTAKELAHTYYQEWDHFHGNYVLDQYLLHEPALPAEAFLDMFKELHQKEEFTCFDRDHAQKIANILTSDLYIVDFAAWLNEVQFARYDIENNLTKNLFAQQYDVDVKSLITKDLPTQVMEHDEITLMRGANMPSEITAMMPVMFDILIPLTDPVPIL